MESVIDNNAMNDIATHFRALSSIVPLHPVRTHADYKKAVSILNQLLYAGASDENHPLADLVETLGELVGDYDGLYFQLEEPSGAGVLRFLMDQHGLKQAGLPEVGTQGVVSQILNEKRDLNVRQIKLLAERFHVNPAVFL